ncbi:AC2 protein [Lycianthes yellow mosaic virus]|uniref:Transcriptional activator protein n=1 Tax=Lycianthes yellow mosaic virus TaxID=1779714 RepID=A0A140D6R0_9GEMI|nr:AC2 protein [Lycianthes yellow mosaic virus]AMK07576.1 AC2 protein [Lycianthes yellow mosaic virus]
MRPSSPFGNHSSQVPQKIQHKIAKKRITRRRRIDLDCGCSYYLSINCHGCGFSHRGIHHCNSGAEWRLYLDGSKSPLFQGAEAHQQTFQQRPRLFGDTNPVQPQPAESSGDSQVFLNLPHLDSFTSSDLAFLKSI